MHASDTLMYREAHEAADVVARQFAANDAVVTALAQTLRAQPPRFIVTCARGSSDHAAAYAKYVFETQLGIVTASASPSVTSVYAAEQHLVAPADVLRIDRQVRNAPRFVIVRLVALRCRLGVQGVE